MVLIITLCVSLYRLLVRIIDYPVIYRIIANIKYSIVQLFTSLTVAIYNKFIYDSSIYTTTNISLGIVICILDKSNGSDTINIPMADCSDLITSYNSV